MTLFYRPKFLEDMAREEVWLMEHASATVADRWHEAVVRTIHTLAANPYFGRARTDLEFQGVRSWLVEDFPRWVIFYGVRDDALIFYRVVSGTMNLQVLRFD
jgi:plasmid stabilization system protein ParE